MSQLTSKLVIEISYKSLGGFIQRLVALEKCQKIRKWVSFTSLEMSRFVTMKHHP